MTGWLSIRVVEVRTTEGMKVTSELPRIDLYDLNSLYRLTPGRSGEGIPHGNPDGHPCEHSDRV